MGRSQQAQRHAQGLGRACSDTGPAEYRKFSRPLSKRPTLAAFVTPKRNPRWQSLWTVNVGFLDVKPYLFSDSCSSLVFRRRVANLECRTSKGDPSIDHNRLE